MSPQRLSFELPYVADDVLLGRLALWLLANRVLRPDDVTKLMGVLLFETFFRSRHPFIACSEKLTGILLPRIQRFLFLGEVEVGSFHHINRLILGTRRILHLLILCRGLLFHGGLAVAVALYNRGCAP